MIGPSSPVLYLDEDCQRQGLIAALDRLKIITSTSAAAGMDGSTDVEQLEMATRQEWSIVTSNIADFCRLHVDFLSQPRTHGGIILIPQQRYTVGEQERRLLQLVLTLSTDEMRNRLEFLSGWEPATI